MERRELLKRAALGAAAVALPADSWPAPEEKNANAGAVPPDFLKNYAALYRRNPREATLQWFRDARFGLFIHYGLYSLHGIHPFEQHRFKIPVAEYSKLKDRFTAEKFDADFITSLALEAGMKYVTLVTKHCDGFCLWNTKQTDFNSMNSAARRDLVGEMAEACRKKGLGLFLFYEHGFEWHHPHGPRRKDFPIALCEVPYDPPEPSYAYGAAYDLQQYVAYVSAQITELLTQYGSVAGIWLDGAAVPRSGDQSKFHLLELYGLIHRLQPQALVSYKWGVTGAEDFFAPERAGKQVSMVEARGDKPMEICVAIQPAWGYAKDQPRMDAEGAMKELRNAASQRANLLLNIGPLGDGSVHPDDVKTLREVGRRIRQQGLPAPGK